LPVSRQLEGDIGQTPALSPKRLPALELALCVSVYLCLAVWSWPYTMDDSFIGFRYARHIGDGIGPIWNLADRNDPIEGFTSFLFVWALGLIRWLTGADVELLGKVSGGAAVLGIAWSVALEARRHELRTPAALIAFSFLLLPYTALNAVSGMETGLFMLWNWLCAVVCVRLLDTPSARAVWWFVLLGLLGTLTRPDFGLPFGLMTALLLWRQPSLRAPLWKAILVGYVIPGLAVTAWRYSFYHDVVPNPFYVKQRKGLDIEGITYVARFLALCALPYLLWIGAGWRSLWSHRRNLLLVLGVTLGAPAAYFSTVMPTMGWWYRFLLPYVPLLGFCAALAFQESAKNPSRGTKGLRLAAGALLLLLPLVHLPLLARFLVFHKANEVRYREVGRRLRPMAAPDRWLLYHDVGSLVYEAEWNTIDPVGLNTHRSKLKSRCAMAPEVLLESRRFSKDHKNPCPARYVVLAELPFIKQDPIVDSSMRVLVRDDVTFKEELRQSLVDAWPEQFSRPPDWRARYQVRFGSIFND